MDSNEVKSIPSSQDSNPGKEKARLINEWNALVKSLEQSWEQERSTIHINANISDMADFLCENGEYLIQIGALPKMKCVRIIGFLNLLLEFTWDPQNHPIINKEVYDFLKQQRQISLELSVVE